MDGWAHAHVFEMDYCFFDYAYETFTLSSNVWDPFFFLEKNAFMELGQEFASLCMVDAVFHDSVMRLGTEQPVTCRTETFLCYISSLQF
jgi:hypothetical protein